MNSTGFENIGAEPSLKVDYRGNSQMPGILGVPGSAVPMFFPFARQVLQIEEVGELASKIDLNQVG